MIKIKHLKQTNTAILFAEINGSKNNMDSMLQGCEETGSVDSRKYKEICDECQVHSFSEFLKKFEPVVYMTADTNGNYSFSTKESAYSVPIKLNEDNVLVSMISKIIETKAEEDISFNWEQCIQMLDSKTTVAKIEKKRKDMKYLADQIQTVELDSKKKEYEKLLNREVTETRKYYNNPIMLLPYLIEQNNEYIKEADRMLQLSDPDKHCEDVKIAIPTFDSEKGVTYNEPDNEPEMPSGTKGTSNIEINEKSVKMIEDKINQCYDYEQNKNSLLAKNNMRSAVLQVFKPASAEPVSYTPEERERVFNVNEKLKSQYAQYMTEFSKLAQHLIEIVMGVKTFFEQYGTLDGKMKPALFVSNCNVSDLTYSRWKPFFSYTNSTPSNLDNAIWYALVPNVSFIDDAADEFSDDDPFADESVKVNATSVNVAMSDLKLLLKEMKKYEIQTFFSFEGNENNTFSTIMKNGTKSLREKTKSLEGEDFSDIAIACYPNFTVISEQSSGQNGIDSIYVGACFAACGLVCAYQSPEYLASKKFSVDDKKEIPGVRFDIESNAPNVPSVLSVEIKGYTTNIKKEILDYGHGFQFCSEGDKYATVLIARSLQQEDTGTYEPIYKRTTATYIERLLDFNFAKNNGYTLEDIEEMYGEESKIYWKKFEDFDNCILGRKDKVTPEEINSSEVEIKISLSNVVKKVSVNVKK